MVTPVHVDRDPEELAQLGHDPLRLFYTDGPSRHRLRGPATEQHLEEPL